MSTKANTDGSVNKLVTIFAICSCFLESLSCSMHPDTRICPTQNFCTMIHLSLPPVVCTPDASLTFRVFGMMAKTTPWFAPIRDESV